MITRVDHIVVLVEDLSLATASYERLLGLSPSWRGDHPDMGTANALFRLANTYLELLAPVGAGALADGLRERLASQGEGPLALAFATDDAAATADALRTRGVDVPAPAEGHGRERTSGVERRWRSFLLPVSATNGVALMVIEHLSPTDLLPMSVANAAEESVVTAVDHVVVMTARGERAIATYGDKLGLRLALDRTFEERKMRLLFFRVGGLTVECAARIGADSTLGPRLEGGDDDRFWGISYKVADVGAARARLVNGGFDVSEVRDGLKPGTAVCTIRGGTHGVATLVIGPRAGAPLSAG